MQNLEIVESNIKFSELEKTIFSLVCELGCNILKDILENQDKILMQNRDKKTYRHKGYRVNCIKTLMGEIEYKRAMYLVENGKTKKHIFLLDQETNINCIGKISSNLAEKMLKTVVDTISYRKGAEEIRTITNETISHEGLRDLVYKIGQEIEEKEKQLIKLHKQEKLYQGTREIPALFEEADGLWVNLQGKDREEQIEKYKQKCEKENKKYEPLRKVKSELKLHVMHEGWEKDNKRHSLVNKEYIAGFMTPKTLEKIRNAKVYQKYNEENIKLRVLNGDGANWIKNICSKDTIYQKDSFHIHQEIIRDIKEKEYQEELRKMFEEKRYSQIPKYIEYLKYELGGEEKIVKKLTTLQKYLKDGLSRYQDIAKEKGIEIPQAPKGTEYRDMGIMESQIFSVLKVKLASGRKSFSKSGATYLSKVCALYTETQGNIKIDNIEREIEINNDVEEWIKQIEENVRKNKRNHRADRQMTEEYNYAQAKIVEYNPKLQEILKLAKPTELIYR